MKKYDFMFISNFSIRQRPRQKKFECLSGFFNNLSKYCNSWNKSFCIAKVYTRKDKNRYSNKKILSKKIFC